MPARARARTRSISPSTQATGCPSRAASREVAGALRGTWVRLCPPIAIARSPWSRYRLVSGVPGRPRAGSGLCGSKLVGLEGADVRGCALRSPDARVVVAHDVGRVCRADRRAPAPKAVAGGAREAWGRLYVVDEGQAIGHRSDVAVAVVPCQVVDYEVAGPGQAVAPDAGVSVVGDDVVGDRVVRRVVRDDHAGPAVVHDRVVRDEHVGRGGVELDPARKVVLDHIVGDPARATVEVDPVARVLLKPVAAGIGVAVVVDVVVDDGHVVGPRKEDAG